MNIKKIIDDYVECNDFEIKIKNGKIKIYYYDKINHFSSDKITITKNKEKVIIIGKKLVIETMFKEFVVISGLISKIMLGNENE